MTLSSESKEIRAMLQKLDAVPDIRPKAEEIKLAVERGGTYQISPQQIAQKNPGRLE